MKQVATVADGRNFSAISVGKLNELNEYVLELGPDVKIPGKVFGGAALHATGGEFSFQVFQPGTETGFLHTHKQFQVDGEVIPVAEGSVVRVAPAGERSVRNNGTEPLVMLCVQYRAHTFTEADAADGNILQKPVVW